MISLTVLSGGISIGHIPHVRSFTWAGEMACAKVPLDELHVTFGPQGKERTLPALVSEDVPV